VRIRKNAVLLSLEILMFTSLVGCGWWSSGKKSTTETTKGQSGKVTQGAVSGATVWADSLASGSRFVLDSSEEVTKATTASDGTFTLPEQPSYKSIIVSQGGTDTITGQTATTLIAPAGSASGSVLTTLVEFDTSGKLAAIINALLPSGKTFDEDITSTGGLTPAALLVNSSVESAVTTLNTTIVDSATASSAILTQQQKDNIGLTAYSAIATQFSGLSAASLSNTQTLASNLQAALQTALTTIAANNSNIVLSTTSTGASKAKSENTSGVDSIATSIADSAVATAANVVGNATGDTALQGVTTSNVQSPPGVTASTSNTVTEATVLTYGNNTTLINDAVAAAATTAASSVTTASTPSSYSPPTITVANNPTITHYQLSITASNSEWTVNTFQITFSDDMIATTSGNNSVLNSANYVFSQGSCTPSSYASKVVIFTCSSLAPGTFTVRTNAATSSSGVEASATSLGLLVNTTKSFTLSSATGSTGGSTIDMF
jgi:hypothetical protein